MDGRTLWCLVETVQVVNTEVAEQTFSRLRGSRKSLRRMGAWSSQVLLAMIVHQLNEDRLLQFDAEAPKEGVLTNRWSLARHLGEPLSMLLQL